MTQEVQWMPVWLYLPPSPPPSPPQARPKTIIDNFTMINDRSFSCIECNATVSISYINRHLCKDKCNQKMFRNFTYSHVKHGTHYYQCDKCHYYVPKYGVPRHLCNQGQGKLIYPMMDRIACIKPAPVGFSLFSSNPLKDEAIYYCDTCVEELCYSQIDSHVCKSQ